MEALKKLLEHYDRRYYEDNVSEVPDAVYDALKDRLGVEYQHVPGRALGTKVRHQGKVLSLAKVTARDALEKELVRLGPNPWTEYKADGLTVVLYPDGVAVTRGDGEVGDDVSRNFHKVNGVPSFNPPFPIRFEVVMRKDVFATLGGRFANPRNAAAGIMMSSDGDGAELLTALALTIDIPGANVTTKRRLLEDLGYQLIPGRHWTAAEIVSFDKNSAPYELDGLVIKSDVEGADEHFGFTGHHPKSMVAFKFPSEGDWTTLRNVFWQVGRSGRVTPVGFVAPVSIGGSTVRHVTLHNMGVINTLRIQLGADVHVVKANDVIPAVIDSRGEGYTIEPPESCPSCSGPLLFVGNLLYCNNPLCFEKIAMSIVHIAKRDALNIEGLSDETAYALLKARAVRNPFDIFKLKKSDLLKIPGFAEKSAQNLMDELDKARSAPLNRFLYAAGLPEIGRTACREIALKFGTFEALMQDLRSGGAGVASIPGIGDKMMDIILRSGKAQWEQLVSFVTPLPMQSAVQAKTFVITGTLSTPRANVEKMILDAGHKLGSSVSKNTDYLVCGADAGSKLEKATKLGVKVVKEEELAALLA